MPASEPLESAAGRDSLMDNCTGQVCASRPSDLAPPHGAELLLVVAELVHPPRLDKRGRAVILPRPVLMYMENRHRESE